jgi:hypothetical protein
MHARSAAMASAASQCQPKPPLAPAGMGDVGWEAAWAAWDAIETECEAQQPAKKRRRRARACADDGRPTAAPTAAVVHPRAAAAAARADEPAPERPPKCISMHQPWASLLVAGIKTVEGRSWSTKHRGPLWIASTAKKCDRATLDRVRADWAASGASQGAVSFPAAFPAASLLGRVDVSDCLERSEWQRRVQCGTMPDEPNDSAFLFVCEHPRPLTQPLPVKGLHRIWSLPVETAAAAMADVTAQQQQRRRQQRQQPRAAPDASAVDDRKAAVAKAAADPGRTKVRTAFAKALAKTAAAAAGRSPPALPAHRPAMRAAEVESALFAAHSQTVSDAYKERARSLLYNLRDALNGPLRGAKLPLLAPRS